MGLALHTTVTTATGTLQTTASNTGTIYGCQAPIATLNFSANQPVVAFYSASTQVTIVTCQQTSAGQWSALFWSAAAATFEVFVFDRMDAVPASNARCGLQVFNSSGQLIADAVLPMLRPLSYLSGNIAGMGAGWGQIGWPGPFSTAYSTGVAKAATACCVTALCVYQPGGNSNSAQNTLLGISGWSHNGGNATFTWSNATYGSPGSAQNWVGYGSALNWAGLLIDVSNF
jgi:hypothetical protein